MQTYNHLTSFDNTFPQNSLKPLTSMTL